MKKINGFKTAIMLTTTLISLNALAEDSNIHTRNVFDTSLSEQLRTIDDDVDIEPMVSSPSDATLEEFPYYARVVYTDFATSYNHMCGASILTENSILTAAHCFSEDIPLENYAVIINNTNKLGVYLEELRPISSFNIHPDYNEITISDDIAVITLSSPITEDFEAISIASNDDIVYYNDIVDITVAGMGYNDSTEVTPDNLKKADLYSQADPICATLLANIYGADYNADKQMCATKRDGSNSCKGDSGGPLTYLKDGKYNQIGLVSYGSSQDCGEGTGPSVYTEITAYRDFIEDNTSLMFEESFVSASDSSDDTDGDSGGSFGFISLFFLFSLTLFRKRSV